MRLSRLMGLYEGNNTQRCRLSRSVFLKVKHVLMMGVDVSRTQGPVKRAQIPSHHRTKNEPSMNYSPAPSIPMHHTDRSITNVNVYLVYTYTSVDLPFKVVHQVFYYNPHLWRDGCNSFDIICVCVLPLSWPTGQTYGIVTFLQYVKNVIAWEIQ